MWLCQRNHGVRVPIPAVRTCVTDSIAKRKYGRAWKRIRDRYVAEHPLCEMCLEQGKLTPVDEVHHVLPVSKGGTHARGNLMALCRSCHNKIHHELGDR